MADAEEIEHWQFDYNWRRPYGSLNGKTPCERIGELSSVIPDHEEIAVSYELANEPVRFSNWSVDRATRFAFKAQQLPG